jgi:preprotein translocase subunit SecA
VKRLRLLLNRIRGIPVEGIQKRHRRWLARVEDLAAGTADRTDTRMQEEASRLRARLRANQPLDELLPECFALVREASRRVLDLWPFDEQVLSGIALHDGKLVEQPTGEGKTLAAVLPAFLNALHAKGVHVLTFNDYLARRDAAWMGPIYEFLGLSVGCVHEGLGVSERQGAYRCDVTYLTAKEAGFDFLRDQLCRNPDQVVQRPFHYAIVDEADSILIDEARVPLVIAGHADATVLDPHRATELVGGLDAETDFVKDPFARHATFTERGLDVLEAALGCGNLHAPENFAHLTALHLALHARVLLHRDVHYIVREGRIELVDEFTGRVVDDRRWPDGLQAAVEAKEGVELQREGQVLGSITIQHLMELYPKLSGMTATAVPAAEEARGFYGLQVVVIPPHRECVREDLPDRVFRDKAGKLEALLAEIRDVHATGRPILVGTATVRESEELVAALVEAGPSPQVLNAKNDEIEAGIVARAGERGAITIATNMAGRGTDIRLGGPDERDRAGVVALGGLYVIGTNRHESRRIDDQLRGRAGRQGDPGSSRFFISLEDDLFVRYGIREFLPQEGPDSARETDDATVHREIERAQRIIEGQTFEIRRSLWRYSSLVERHRRLFGAQREQVLRGESLPPTAGELGGRHAALQKEFDRPVLRDVERRITLAAMDRCWPHHLARVAHIRSGMHLFGLVRGGGGLGGSSVFGLGGPAPIDEFHSRANDSYAQMNREVHEMIVRTFETAKIGRDGLDLDDVGLRAPSSTWTYLIQENPLGDALDRLVTGVLRKLRKKR